MYRNLGLDLEGCAKLLHVTERTLHNWQSGKHDIPYAAYRLLRLLNRMELPGDSWAGWCFHGGKLWTPEGRSFVGTDGSWWSLLVRRAAGFDALYRQMQAVSGGVEGGQAERRTPSAWPLDGLRSAVTPQSSTAHGTTSIQLDGLVTRQASLTGETKPPANDSRREAA